LYKIWSSASVRATYGFGWSSFSFAKTADKTTPQALCRPNVLRLGDVADFQHKSSIELLLLKLAQMFHRSTSAAILPNRCSSDTFGESNLY
jgi:hypothetical protein